MTLIKNAALCAISLLSWQTVASALEETTPNFIAPLPWQEQAVSLPDYPRDADLRPFPVDLPALAQTFTLDSRSLRVGADGVVRYSAVITSIDGARNVLFEGIRCATREFRTYAYGGPEHRFNAATSDNWNNISAHDWGAFRAVLLRDYLCDEQLSPYHLNEIKRRLSHPESVR